MNTTTSAPAGPASLDAEARPAQDMQLEAATVEVNRRGEASPEPLPQHERYGQALRDCIESPSEPNWLVLRDRTRDLAKVSTSIAEALDAHWDAVRQAGTAGALLDGPEFDAARRAEREIAGCFDALSRHQGASWARLASAYGQKNREIEALLDSLPALAFLKDSTGRYITANRQFCDTLGIPAGRLASLSDSDLFPPETARQFLKRDREVLDGSITAWHEETFEQNGKRYTYLIVKAPVRDANGAACGLIGVGFDLTERKKIEDEHARLAAAIDATGDAVMIVANEGGIQYVNPAFERLTGRSAAELLGADPGILGASYADGQAEQGAERAMADGVPWKGFVRYLHKNGDAFETDETIAPIRGADGQVTSYVYVLRDISERRRMVETLERAVMVKSEFTNMVSHELRTPLTAIKESVLVVADGSAGPLNDRQDYFLKIAARNLERLHRLINDTLDFSKIERGEFHIRTRLADLNSLVSEIVHQQRLAANKNGLRLEMSLDPSMGEVPVDSDRICQVLVNLIGNAVRYCERGWVEVTTTKVGLEALVKVQDTGPGIPAEKLDWIFDAFVQLSTGDKRRTGGTGLGLAISRQIIEMHGGSIWVESEVGRGSAFYFSLPTESEDGEGDVWR